MRRPSLVSWSAKPCLPLLWWRGRRRLEAEPPAAGWGARGACQWRPHRRRRPSAGPSARPQCPPGCGRQAAVPLDRPRPGDAGARGLSCVLEKAAAAAAPLAGGKDGAACTTAGAGAPMVDCGHHGPAGMVKSFRRSDVAAPNDSLSGAGSDELGKKEVVPAMPLQAEPMISGVDDGDLGVAEEVLVEVRGSGARSGDLGKKEAVPAVPLQSEPMIVAAFPQDEGLEEGEIPRVVVVQNSQVSTIGPPEVVVQESQVSIIGPPDVVVQNSQVSTIGPSEVVVQESQVSNIGPPEVVVHNFQVSTIGPPEVVVQNSQVEKKMKVKAPAHLRMEIATTSALGSKGKLKDEVVFNLDGDDIVKALVVRKGELELYLNNSENGSKNADAGIRECIFCQKPQYGSENADARIKFKKLCKRFELLCRALVQAKEQDLLKIRRIDLKAAKVISQLPGFTKQGPIVGEVPGVEVGDEFVYRVQLAIVGLHRVYQGGIDTTKYRNGKLIAISIVASGGYPDELSCSGELIYTGSGGRPAGKKDEEDQKLERGNHALKNCMETQTPVRVIHGFKGQHNEGGSNWRVKEISTFTYDGLYRVVDFWMDGQPGSMVFKYKLQKIPGQPELPVHIAKGIY